VPVTEETDYLTITGFVGKPETARKTRGDQYFFVNNRFIRSAYLNHAVTNAFEDLISKDSYPGYILFIELDPSQIDINVHPTKQEIKFTDEKIAYAFVQAAVKHALAQFSIAPSLDFSLNADIQQLDAISQPFTGEKQQQVVASNLYQAFTQKNQAHLIEPGLKPWQVTREQDKDIRAALGKVTPTESAGTNGESVWKSELAKLKEQFFEPDTKTAYGDFDYEKRPVSRESRFQWLSEAPLIQLHGSYIVAISNQGYFLVHQQNAHERVLYEQLSKAIYGKPVATQQSLFPATFELRNADAVLLSELLPDLHMLGYHIEPFGQNSFVVQGTPADLETGNEKKLVEELLEQFKHFNSEVKFSKREKLVRSLACQQSIKSGRLLTEKEMRSLVDQLFLCSVPNATPTGNPTYISYHLNQMEKMFGK
jgi:DNA mismatch repair protein MutL